MTLGRPLPERLGRREQRIKWSQGQPVWSAWFAECLLGAHVKTNKNHPSPSLSIVQRSANGHPAVLDSIRPAREPEPFLAAACLGFEALLALTRSAKTRARKPIG